MARCGKIKARSMAGLESLLARMVALRDAAFGDWFAFFLYFRNASVIELHRCASDVWNANLELTAYFFRALAAGGAKTSGFHP